MARALYISYFGVNEPLVRTQVIPYVRELARSGHEMSLLTFEPNAIDEDEVRRQLSEQGIEWHWLKYHKSPSVPATLFDIFNGARFVAKLSKKNGYEILHARSHVPMMMATLSRRFGHGRSKILFDIRGLMGEEYTDSGVWQKEGVIYRVFKTVERRLFAAADAFVVLTKRAADHLFKNTEKPFEVIPCCLDFSRADGLLDQRDALRSELGLESRYVIVHVGSLGGLYLTDEIVEVMKVARKRNEKAYALFLTQRAPSDLADKLLAAGLTRHDFVITSASPEEVMQFLAASDVGLSFVQKSFSSIARSPTKIPEYLAAGLPVISSADVGDVDALLHESGLGVIVNDLSESGYEAAFLELEELGDISERCRIAAHQLFDLDTIGRLRYERIYSKMVA